ncbi:MAG: hypothetical protein ACXWM7_01360, partial [Parachlamydiaceae bacterium]
KKECFSFESIPNKIVVRLLPSEIHFVLKEIRPLVGGESHKIQYPGLSVLEGVLLIKQYWSEIKVEEITIVRRFHEAERIFSKMQHGMTFFYYQFIFKTGNLKQVLSELKMMSDTAQNQHGQTAF